MNEINEKYMRRALQLARLGQGLTSPNPMVGAVITDSDGKIIGEGYHHQYGGPHAEVNAIADVKDQRLLENATIYVTLEPCSHYGKTPPCAKLLIDKKIPRIVIASTDPHDKVCGRGISMLKDAGATVITGVLDKESKAINAPFFTYHTFNRPFVTLKWAQSADGFLDKTRTSDSQGPAKISTASSATEVHKLRAWHDAILVGAGTIFADKPRLDTRFCDGRNPLPIILDRRHLLKESDLTTTRRPIIFNENVSIEDLLESLYSQGITSVLVEGGATVLQQFIDANIWDLIRIETGIESFGSEGSVKAPVICRNADYSFLSDANHISLYSQNPFIDVKNL